jgi:hypothetical protein
MSFLGILKRKRTFTRRHVKTAEPVAAKAHLIKMSTSTIKILLPPLGYAVYKSPSAREGGYSRLARKTIVIMKTTKITNAVIHIGARTQTHDHSIAFNSFNVIKTMVSKPPKPMPPLACFVSLIKILLPLLGYAVYKSPLLR